MADDGRNPLLLECPEARGDYSHDVLRDLHAAAVRLQRGRKVRDQILGRLLAQRVEELERSGRDLREYYSPWEQEAEEAEVVDYDQSFEEFIGGGS